MMEEREWTREDSEQERDRLFEEWEREQDRLEWRERHDEWMRTHTCTLDIRIDGI